MSYDVFEILLVEDNPADVDLTREALGEAKMHVNLNSVEDGVEAMEYLRHEGKFKDASRPDLILLDLNLPRKDGREVLREIKNDPALKGIPVVVLSSSEAENDVVKSYAHGANCYVAKPVAFNQFVQIVQTVGDFWFTLVKLPPRGAETAVASVVSVNEETESGGTRILLVEDNPGDAELVKEMLVADFLAPQFEIDHAGSLAEGLQKIRQQRYDLVLLDLSLPDSFGYETFARMHDAAPAMPIVILTVSDDMNVALNSVRSGAQDYLVKGTLDGDLVRRVIRYAIERKKSERGLAELLERERQARKQAEDAVYARDELLSIASHEMKTPVTSFKMKTDLMRKYFSGQLDRVGPQFSQYLTECSSVAVRLSHLVDNLMSLSRIDAERLHLTLEAVDLRSMVMDSIGRLREQLDSAGCRVDLDAPEPIHGVFDKFRLEQVVTNLLTNAMKYGPGKPIRVTIREDDGKAVFEVCDQGIGVPEPERDRIFDRYTRTHDAIQKAPGGLGLGLYIVRQIVRFHGGTIRVGSSPEGGAAFTVELPLRAVKSAGEAAA